MTCMADSADDGSCHERLTSREECIPKRCISFCRESHEGSFAYCNETLPSICECWYPCSRLIRRQRERSIWKQIGKERVYAFFFNKTLLMQWDVIVALSKLNAFAPSITFFLSFFFFFWVETFYDLVLLPLNLECTFDKTKLLTLTYSSWIVVIFNLTLLEPLIIF